MKIFAVQYDITWEDKRASHATVARLIQSANPARGSLVVLPEMFSTGFSMNVRQIDDGATSVDRDFLSATACRHAIYLMGGLVAREAGGRGLNCAVVFDPAGHQCARYTKLHPFSPGKEAEHYSAGQEIVTFACGDAMVAPFICYDLRFPEGFRRAVRQDATVFTVIANWPAARVEHWVTLLKARAIENQSYVIGVNRCGSDPFLQYPGRSLIVDPRGNVIADAGNAEQVISAELDIDALGAYRRDLPFLRDMREDLLNAPFGRPA